MSVPMTAEESKDGVKLKMTEEELKGDAELKKAKACLDCPVQRGVETTLPAIPSFRHTVASIRVRVTCGACDSQKVKPPTETCHTKCRRWKRFRSSPL
jgi:hypothetical protein